jgi:hypothetical protein
MAALRPGGAVMDMSGSGSGTRKMRALISPQTNLLHIFRPRRARVLQQLLLAGD